jgi:hypothetical protein
MNAKSTVFSQPKLSKIEQVERTDARPPYVGRFNAPEGSLNVSGNFSGSGPSQSMQRNLRPPVFASSHLIGLPHFLQGGGDVFFGTNALAVWLRTIPTLAAASRGSWPDRPDGTPYRPAGLCGAGRLSLYQVEAERLSL